ncbi:ribosomal protein S18 acetylase RimI-like enzyme [Chitinivorax tropicus]|uniref:Ribosomal protein S18 acetylase RimI-like enzyme n=1 Tax=Chitinivorax tropicus TaxID=714531 RepID=A0A840MS45_9PROT|nr:GNAT family N-acetyltransferase [Chitinivorax tropicus]MBB5019967.1 ribosomal protein S18 acetylase RimI-like enzyme [Chitinivorax tropicus]
MPFIRPATPADATTFSEVAQAAKAHWGYPQQWLHVWRPQLTISAAQITQDCYHALQLGDQVIGLVGICFAHGQANLVDCWILPAYMGKGWGRLLIRAAAQSVQARGLTHVLIESDPYARGFYEHLGATLLGWVDRPVLGVDRKLPLLSLDLSKFEKESNQ